MHTFFAYFSPDDCVTFTHDTDDLDDATDEFLSSRNIDPDAIEFDCVSDHVTIVFTNDDMIVIADAAQTDIALADIFH